MENQFRFRIKRAVSVEGFVFLAVFLGFFSLLGVQMGLANMLNTLMKTAYQLLLETVFYIMAIAVITGALAGLLSEFGVVAMLNKLLSPLMKPIYHLPGASSIGILTTYLSDNPAILTLADDQNFKRYFKKYQLPALTNIGTAFGMGLIITTFMLGLQAPGGGSFARAALVGNLGAVVGSIVSTRLMLRATSKVYGTDAPCELDYPTEAVEIDDNHRVIRQGSLGMRVMDSMLSGGKTGVELGLSIIPGVLIICTVVLMLTNGPSASGLYTGAAYEGVALLPWLGDRLSFLLRPLFGFTSAEALAVPITALGSAGAAIGLIPNLVGSGAVAGRDIAVFTAMCMCWSGYLSTHVAMMDSLKCRNLTSRAIICHTIGGLCAGVFANWLYFGLSLIW